MDDIKYVMYSVMKDYGFQRGICRSAVSPLLSPFLQEWLLLVFSCCDGRWYLQSPRGCLDVMAIDGRVTSLERSRIYYGGLEVFPLNLLSYHIHLNGTLPGLEESNS